MREHEWKLKTDLKKSCIIASSHAITLTTLTNRLQLLLSSHFLSLHSQIDESNLHDYLHRHERQLLFGNDMSSEYRTHDTRFILYWKCSFTSLSFHTSTGPVCIADPCNWPISRDSTHRIRKTESCCSSRTDKKESSARKLLRTQRGNINNVPFCVCRI